MTVHSTYLYFIDNKQNNKILGIVQRINVQNYTLCREKTYITINNIRVKTEIKSLKYSVYFTYIFFNIYIRTLG